MSASIADEVAGSSSTHDKRQIRAERSKLHIAMTVLQFGYAGSHIILRAALNMGVSKLVFPVFRNITALLLLLPFACILEKNDRPPLNLSFLMQFFLLGLIGITCNQGFYLLGLDNTTPTFASAIQNAVPAVTFLMAALFRIEQVELKRKDGKAKVLGTLASVAGASVMTLYKGPTIYGHQKSQPDQLGDASWEKNWTFGCICLIGHCLCWSSWIVLQASVLKKYPARLSVTSYTCFFGSLQFLALAAYAERDSGAWQIRSGGEVFSILYSGVVASAMGFTIQTWAIDKGGPVFVSIYLPLQTLLVALIASIVFGEQFYLGGIIGAVLIVAGLYLVVWGKSEEVKFAKEKVQIFSTMSDQSSLVQSLLPTHNS